MFEDDGWLNGGPIRCGGCAERLYRVDHSPFLDCYFLYCDGCPRRVDVSLYDPVLLAVDEALKAAGADSYETLMAQIEPRLRPCDCGGAFRDDAPRRCHGCAAVLADVDPAAGIDVWPVWWGDEGVGVEAERGFTAAWFRTEDLWIVADPSSAA